VFHKVHAPPINLHRHWHTSCGAAQQRLLNICLLEPLHQLHKILVVLAVITEGEIILDEILGVTERKQDRSSAHFMWLHSKMHRVIVKLFLRLVHSLDHKIIS